MVNTISSMSLSLRNNGYYILIYYSLSFPFPYLIVSTTKNIVNIQIKKIICIIKFNCRASNYQLFNNSYEQVWVTLAHFSGLL